VPAYSSAESRTPTGRQGSRVHNATATCPSACRCERCYGDRAPAPASQAIAALQRQGFELVKDFPELNFLVATPGQLASAIPLPGQPTVAVQASTVQRASALSQAQGIVQVRKEFPISTARAAATGITKSLAAQSSAGACPGDCSCCRPACAHLT
jgi:hypothetical protein